MIRKLTAILLYTIFLISSGNAFAANPCGLNASKIMQAIKHPSWTQHNDLTIVVAHRGLHGSVASSKYYYTPENSRESLDNADKECLEAIELDVRINSQAINFITHDYNWGREAMTPNSAGKCCYNPYDFSGPNPPVQSTDYATVQKFTLRPTTDLYKSSAWNEHPPTLDEILTHYQKKGYQYVIFLDIKDDTAFTAAWQTVASHNMTDRVIFKVAASLYPYPDYIREKFVNLHYACGCSFPDTKYLNVMVYYSTSDIAPGNRFGASPGENKVVDSASRWNQWNYSNSGEQFFAGMEINIKEPGAILAKVAIAMQNQPITKGIFNPVGEFHRNGTADWFYNSDGSCCSRMSSYFFNGDVYGLPSDKADRRLESQFLKDHITPNYINLITTDTPLEVAQMLQSWGKRNTLKYFR